MGTLSSIREKAECVRVLVVDDHPIMRRGVRHSLSRHKDFEIVGEAGTIAEAQESTARLKPDVVVLDLVLGGRDGLEGIAELRRVLPGVRILVFSMNPEEIYAPLALAAGANGYLMKSHDFEELHRALVQILAGEIYLSPGMAVAGERPASEIDEFTGREMQVFLRLGEGKTTSEIAYELNLSVKTVFTHRDSLKAKLKVKSGAELMRRAMVHVLRQGGFHRSQ